MKICVVALGKIGLPLAVQFASKGHEVIGADVNAALVDQINAGIEPFPGEAELDVRLKQAVAAGGRVEKDLQNQFYGDRSGTLYDPFGHMWTIATHVEDVSPEEMKRRMDKYVAEQKK